MFEKFTARARRVVVIAQDEARLRKHDHIQPDHLFLGLLAEHRRHGSDGLAGEALEALDVELDATYDYLQETLGEGEEILEGHIPFTRGSKTALELTLRESLALGHEYISAEHLLLGVVREGTGVAAQLLVRIGADLDSIRREVVRLGDLNNSLATRALNRARVIALGAQRGPEDVDLLHTLIIEIGDSSQEPPALVSMVAHLKGRIPESVRTLGTRPLDDVLSAVDADEPDEWQLLAAVADKPSPSCEAVLATAGLSGAGVVADSRTIRDLSRGLRWRTSRTLAAVSLLGMVLMFAVLALVVIHALGPGEWWELLAIPLLFKGEPTSRPVIPVLTVAVLLLLANPAAAGLQAVRCLVDHQEGRMARRRLRAYTGVHLSKAEYVRYFARHNRAAVQINRSKGFSEARLWRLERQMANQ